MHRPTLLSTLALSLALVACGGGDSSDPRDLLSSGSTALGSKDYPAALADLSAASEALGGDTSNALYADVQKGLLFAQAGAAPDAALASLKARASDMGDNVDIGLYMSVAGHMSDGGNFDQAVEVVKLAIDKFGKSEALDTQVADIMKKMSSAGDAASGALDAMAGLGYVGD